MKEVKDFISQKERFSKKEAGNQTYGLEMLLTEFTTMWRLLRLGASQSWSSEPNPGHPPLLPCCKPWYMPPPDTPQVEKEPRNISRTVCRSPYPPKVHTISLTVGQE